MLIRIFDMLQKISEQLGKSVSYLLLIMTLVSFTIVVIRYVFSTGSIALQESITYFHATVFILMAAFTLQKNGHVRVDIFYQNMNQKQKAWVDIFGSVFLLIPFCIFSFWISLPYVQRSWAIAEKSADAGGIPAVFLLKSLILVLAIILLVQAATEILKNILMLQNRFKASDKTDNQGVM